ncbi:MAG: hypothetical protein U5K71_12160 [Gracilimonas sp.]|nr:hypothetical protein [Gracilimonas sp.]
MFSKENSKKIITLLLFISCVISGIILAASPERAVFRLETGNQLDSLINTHFNNAQILPVQVRTSTIRIDTSFIRKEHRVRVPTRFSKTLFHVGLHKDFQKYDVDVPAIIKFPSRDMHIYVYHEDTIIRTLRLTTDSELDSIYTQ